MKIKLILFILFSILLTSCTTKHKFPINKRFWNIKDYENAIIELKYGYEKDEKLPSFNDPETRIVVKKLTDQNNFKVVLNDKELGLNYKCEISQKFFKNWNDMCDIYTAIDRKDAFVYSKEYLAVWHFGLSLQLKYFHLWNARARKNADDPKSYNVRNTIRENVGVLIKNFSVYLDIIKEENSFYKKGKLIYAKGIDKYFTKLVNLYPKANYCDLKYKAELLFKKSKSKVIKSSLKRLIRLIKTKENIS